MLIETITIWNLKLGICDWNFFKKNWHNIIRWKVLEKWFSIVKSVEYKNIWYNFNQIKIDSVNKEKIYCDDDDEYRS